ncbi:MAG: hypothetical protein KDA28_13315, partial [Phycisphaerales bacterium]|nr:hypothetical protein [Phycisphaerales bacterium]
APAQFRGPDTSVAWSATRRLVVAGIDGAGPRTIAVDGVAAPRWSTDGRHLVFWRAGALWLVDADGGPPIAIADGVEPRAPSSGAAFEQLAYLFPGDDVWGAVADWRG